MLISAEIVRYARKVLAMCDFARSLAALGTDPRIGVGCVVFPVDCSAVVGIGYNGAAEGLDHGSVMAGATQVGAGTSGAAHAEANALAKLLPHREWLAMAVTHVPCPYCAPLIVNSRRVAAVVVGTEKGVERSGIDVLRAAGMTMIRADDVSVIASAVRPFDSAEMGPASDAAIGGCASYLEWMRGLRTERPRFYGHTV